MPDVAEQLDALRRRIADRNEPDFPSAYLQRLAVIGADGRFHLDFYGDPFEDGYFDLLATIAQPEVAPHIRSLILRGPDEGANGTRNWDIEPLLEKDAAFPELESFSVQLNQPTDHNRSVIGADFSEDGVLSKLLARSPKMREFTVPSAPDAAFFDVGNRPVRFLSVDAGYDTQGFISHLAKSSCFPDLRCLEWGEYNETHIDDYLAHCTPAEHYRELFQSKAFASVARLVWRNPVCADEEIGRLKELKPDLQLLVVRSSADYV